MLSTAATIFGAIAMTLVVVVVFGLCLDTVGDKIISNSPDAKTFFGLCIIGVLGFAALSATLFIWSRALS